MALTSNQLQRFALAASVLTAGCDAAGPDGQEVRRSQVQIDLRQLYLTGLQGERITIIDTVTLTIAPANGAEQRLRSLVTSPDALVTFDVSVDTGMVAFSANVLSNNGTSLYTARREVDIQEDGFTVALDLVGQRAVLAVSPDSIMLVQSADSFTVENLGVDTLGWVAQDSPSTDVSIEPLAGIILPGDSQRVTVSDFAGGLPAGESFVVRVLSPEGNLNVKVQGPPLGFLVAVTPDGDSTVVRVVEGSQFSDTFLVRNIGDSSDTYAISCDGTNGVFCTGISDTTVDLVAGDSAAVAASYDVGGVGDGTLVLTAASSRASDQGSFIVPIRPLVTIR
jgi:hypothetical protein